MVFEHLNKGNELRNYFLIAAIGILFFIPYLGRVHLFDWDEINFAEAAREMVVTGNYSTVQIDYEPFHEKPPLFFWLQALSMNIFGINEFAARFPNALIGVVTLMILYSIGKKLFDYRFGMLWVLAYFGSFLPHFYFRTGIIDPAFNLFIFMGVYFISEYSYQIIYFSQSSKYRHKCIIIGGIFTALAVLTKGPVGYLLPMLCWLVIWFMNRKIIKLPVRSVLIFSLVALLPTVLWYAIVILPKSTDIINEFINYQVRLLTTNEAGHGGPIYYHFVVLLAGCFPASILMLRGFRKQQDDSSYQKNFKLWMIVLLCIVLVVFSIVKTKIIHYSSLAYFPITFLAAYTMYSVAFRQIRWKTSSNWLLGIFGFIWAMLFIAIPLLLINSDMLLPRITDEFTRSILRTPVRWGGYEYLVGFIYLSALIASIILFIKQSYLKGFFTLFGATAITIFIFLPVVVPKVDYYIQGAPLEFYSKLKNCNCYIQPLGFKSYAHYFYSGREPYQSPYVNNIPRDDFEKWLLTGKIERPAYFISKNTAAREFLKNPEVHYLYSKNGWVFMKRNPVQN